MKRNLLIIFFVALIAITTTAINLDNRSRAIVCNLGHTLERGKNIKSANDTILGTTYYPVIIKLSNDTVIDDLEDKGVVVMHKRKNFLLACLPIDSLDAISQLPLVNAMSLSAPMSITLNEARKMSRVDNVQTGIDLPQSYTGKGVVVGISDIGFDYSHPAFRDGRLKKLIAYDELHALRHDVNVGYKNELEWTTDNSNEWHASHVAGILAGNYEENQYKGVAVGSEMVITTSNLYEMAILSGVEDVIEYAQSVGKPAVVNLSIGSYVGPHDGTSLFNQYLDLLGEEAIICLSAGNEGKKRGYISYDLKNEGDELKTFVYDNPDVNGIELNGDIDFWSADSSRLSVALTIYDRISKDFVYTSPFVNPIENNTSSWGIATSTMSNKDDVSIPLFETDITGAIRIYSSLNSENNRYNVYATINVKNHQYDDSGLLGRYCIGFIVRGEKGTHIDAYANSSRVIFNGLGVNGFITGNSTRSISDLACGKNVITVGASNSRNKAPRIDGKEETYNFAINNVANFSSYGTLDDGRVLPHFCAPGNMIIAPISSFYTEKFNATQLQILAEKVRIESKDYYWISECGTSMASPHAAGVIACWLQADSTLTVHDVINIAQSTASINYSDISDPRWGAGNIDAYAGLMEVLKRGGVGNVIYESPNMIIIPMGYKEFFVEGPNTQIEKIELYSVSGAKVYSQKTSCINVENLASGVYFIKVLHSKGEQVQRILIK